MQNPRISPCQILLPLVASIFSLAFFSSCATRANGPVAIPPQFQNGKTAPLPLPSSLPLQDYEKQLNQFITNRVYAQKEYRWAYDRTVRDTGPYLLGTSYGIHPSVRMYYSPEILEWLANDRKDPIKDGAIIVKEMFPSAKPAAYYNEMKPEEINRSISAYTIMVKDKSVSKAGWFWAGPYPGAHLTTYDYPFNFPETGPGLGTCIRCHASAEKEMTFSALENIEGFESHGSPMRYRVDDSWRTNLTTFETPAAGKTIQGDLMRTAYRSREADDLIKTIEHFISGTGGPKTTTPMADAHTPDSLRPSAHPPVKSLPAPNPEFLRTFPLPTPPATSRHVEHFPGQWADKVVANPHGPDQFITADNCYGCHGGLGGTPYPLTMFVKTGPSYGDGYNLSEYGEWRWSPMGLAGRDPIFYAQLESEFALLAKDERFQKNLPTVQQSLANTCLSCHGAMGQRQLAIDHQAKKPDITDPNFYLGYRNLTTPLNQGEAHRQSTNTVRTIAGTNMLVAPYHKYGNLAREGISCLVCHHIQPPTQWDKQQADTKMQNTEMLASFLSFSTTGVFPYGKTNELAGPIATDDVKPKPMEHALGLTPVQSKLVPPHPTSGLTNPVPYLTDSKMCGTCHAINLPNVDAPTGKPLHGLGPRDQKILNQAAINNADPKTNPHAVPLGNLLTNFQHSIEQATYLEWENSDFAWNPRMFQSCQDCHMPRGFKNAEGNIDIKQLTTQIAAIEDSSYPDVENDLPDEDLHVKVRDDYHRHELSGLNVFLLEMFNQFDDILGVAKTDYMTSAKNGNQVAIDNMLHTAREKTVRLSVSDVRLEGNLTLNATVKVENLTGHRMPSGVGFRRAFLEVLVLKPRPDGDNEILWSSGRTTSAGVIVGPDGQALPTEFPRESNKFQPHYQTITNQNQVQIYEELVQNAKHEFTSSFIHRVHHPKDNRLLPQGHMDPDSPEFADRFNKLGSSEESFAQLQAFMRATMPGGQATNDLAYRNGGGDTVQYRMTLPQSLTPSEASNLTVRATMYYQAIPPSYLKERFETAPDQPGTQRLYFLTSRLKTDGTAIEDWKLKLVSAEGRILAGK